MHTFALYKIETKEIGTLKASGSELQPVENLIKICVLEKIETLVLKLKGQKLQTMQF